MITSEELQKCFKFNLNLDKKIIKKDQFIEYNSEIFIIDFTELNLNSTDNKLDLEFNFIISKLQREINNIKKNELFFTEMELFSVKEIKYIKKFFILLYKDKFKHILPDINFSNNKLFFYDVHHSMNNTYKYSFTEKFIVVNGISRQLIQIKYEAMDLHFNFSFVKINRKMYFLNTSHLLNTKILETTTCIIEDYLKFIGSLPKHFDYCSSAINLFDENELDKLKSMEMYLY